MMVKAKIQSCKPQECFIETADRLSYNNQFHHIQQGLEETKAFLEGIAINEPELTNPHLSNLKGSMDMLDQIYNQFVDSLVNLQIRKRR